MKTHSTVFALNLNFAGEIVPVTFNGETVVSAITNEKINEFDVKCGFTLKHSQLVEICKEKINKMSLAVYGAN